MRDEDDDGDINNERNDAYDYCEFVLLLGKQIFRLTLTLYHCLCCRRIQQNYGISPSVLAHSHHPEPQLSFSSFVIVSWKKIAKHIKEALLLLNTHSVFLLFANLLRIFLVM